MGKRWANILHETGLGLELVFEYGDEKILNKQSGSAVVGTRGWRKIQIFMLQKVFILYQIEIKERKKTTKP